MTIWFATVRTLNVVIIWLQVIDYQKNQRIQVFPEKDFLLRRIFFPEDFLWRRFSIEKISISLEKISISFKKISISFEKICHFCSLQKQNWGHHMPEPCCPSWIFWFFSRRFGFLSRKFWFLKRRFLKFASCQSKTEGMLCRSLCLAHPVCCWEKSLYYS